MSDAALQPPPSSPELFLVFTRIGLTSFGGGLSGWMLREFVQRRRWLPEDEFLSGLALAQAFPGVNVVNLAIWIGYRFHGTVGALAGFAGIVVPPAVLAVVIGAVFAALTQYQLSHLVLDGIGAAAIGLSLQMGLIAGWRALEKGVWPTILMLLAFVAVGVLHLSLPLVVVALGVIGVALAYRDLTRA
jgi:chromate transporter